MNNILSQIKCYQSHKFIELYYIIVVASTLIVPKILPINVIMGVVIIFCFLLAKLTMKKYVSSNNKVINLILICVSILLLKNVVFFIHNFSSNIINNVDRMLHFFLILQLLPLNAFI
ncbi:MAG: hypothetical protein ACD_26C00043G0004, partial [uncultured bacterium]